MRMKKILRILIIIIVILQFTAPILKSNNGGCHQIWKKWWVNSDYFLYTIYFNIWSNEYLYVVTTVFTNGSKSFIKSGKYDLNGDLEWENDFYRWGINIGWDSVVDKAGNLYSVVGRTFESYILKYDLNGNLIFTNKFVLKFGGDNVLVSIALDKNDNIYVGGRGTTPDGINRGVIEKMTSSGNTIWTQFIKTTGVFFPNPMRYSGVVDIQANISPDSVYICGNKYLGGAIYTNFVARCNITNGGFIWEYATTNNSMNNIYYQKSKNRLIITGDDNYKVFNFNGNLLAIEDKKITDYKDNYFYNIYKKEFNGIYATAVSKYDNDINIVWDNIYPDIYEVYINTYTIDKWGYVFVGGSLYSLDGYEMFIKRIKPDGTLDFTYYEKNEVNYLKCIKLATDKDGYIYAFLSTLNSDFIAKYEQPPYPGDINLTAKEENNYIHLTWNDNMINKRGYKVYRSYNNIDFTCIGRLNKEENEYIDKNKSSSGHIYYKVTATNLAGESESEVVGIENKVDDVNHVIAVPNPVDRRKRNKIIFYKAGKDIKISIWTIRGHKIKEIEYIGNRNREWDLKDYRNIDVPRGVYIAKIEDNNDNIAYLKILVK